MAAGVAVDSSGVARDKRDREIEKEKKRRYQTQRKDSSANIHPTQSTPKKRKKKREKKEKKKEKKRLKSEPTNWFWEL